MRTSTLLASITSCISSVTAHSWVEQLMNVDTNGSYYGAPGYIRHYVPRTTVDFSDTSETWLLPQNPVGGSRQFIDDTDVLCHPNQAVANTTPGYPNLKTTPGNTVALRYLENGHVTQPYNQAGKPASGGLVYIYGTTNPQPNEKLTNVLSWGTNGSLDEGRLLTINPYDDGRCYQVSAVPISLQRQAEFPNPVEGQPGINHETWCQNNFNVPEDATGTMTVYWVWQWPTQPNVDPSDPDGKDEIYTSCMDIDLVQNKAAVKSAVAGLSLGGFEDPATALKNFEQRVANTSFPQESYYYNPGTPIKDTSSSGSNGAATSTVATQPGATSPSTPTQPSASTPTQPGAPGKTGKPKHSGAGGQFGSQGPSTMQTVGTAPTAAPQHASPSNVVYVTETETDTAFATVTEWDNQPTSGPYRRSAKFRRRA